MNSGGIENEVMNMDISGTSTKEMRTNLIINHLPHNLTEPDFHKLFAEMGPIKNYRIMRDLKTGFSFGFGFVDYNSPDDAAKAILQLNNHPIQHKRLKVSYAQPPDGGDEKETNLYIQNLPRVYTVDNLEQLFSQYGKIVQKLVFKDKTTGLPRGVGFVRFENKSEAYAAIDALNGQIPDGGTEPLLVKIAKDNSTKKKSAFQAGYQAGLARGAGGGRTQLNGRGNSFVGRGSYTEMYRRQRITDIKTFRRRVNLNDSVYRY